MIFPVDGLRLLAYAGLAGAGFACGWQIRDWQADSVELVKVQQQEHQRALVADVTRQTLSAIGNIRIEQRTIYQKAEKEIVRDPVYINCRVPADGVQLLNAARSGADGRGVAAGVPADGGDPGR